MPGGRPHFFVLAAGVGITWLKYRTLCGFGNVVGSISTHDAWPLSRLPIQG